MLRILNRKIQKLMQTHTDLTRVMLQKYIFAIDRQPKLFGRHLGLVRVKYAIVKLDFDMNLIELKRKRKKSEPTKIVLPMMTVV